MSSIDLQRYLEYLLNLLFSKNTLRIAQFHIKIYKSMFFTIGKFMTHSYWSITVLHLRPALSILYSDWLFPSWCDGGVSICHSILSIKSAVVDGEHHHSGSPTSAPWYFLSNNDKPIFNRHMFMMWNSAPAHNILAKTVKVVKWLCFTWRHAQQPFLQALQKLVGFPICYLSCSCYATIANSYVHWPLPYQTK